MTSKPALSSSFWTIPLFLGFSGLGTYLALTGNASERRTGWICALLFGAMALITLVWEVGRKFQGEGVSWQEVRMGGQTRRVWLMRASQLEKLLLCAVFSVMVVVVGAILLTSTDAVFRWEMGIVGIICALFILPFALIRLRHPHGIALLPEGVLWLKDGTILLVAWEAIERVGIVWVAQEVGHGIQRHVDAIGMELRSDALSGVMEMAATPVPLKAGTRRILTAQRAKSGCELVFLAESLVPPLAQVEFLLCFFLENPRRRAELRAGQTSLGFLESLLQNPAR